jgi:hypothetical protein
MAQSGALPRTMPEALSAITAAARIAQAQGIKPTTIPGTDLSWPPAQAFDNPMGYAPYLTKFKEILALSTAPKPQPTPAKKEKEAPAAPVPESAPQDPLAGIRKMLAQANPVAPPANAAVTPEMANAIQ